MDMTVETLLQAKAELARLATEPLKYFKATALIATADKLREGHDYVLARKKISADWLFNDKVSAQYALLLVMSWQITNRDVPQPDLLQLTSDQLGDWLVEWENRFSNWTVTEKQLFETSASWEIVNKFLDAWYINIIRSSIPHGRGCAQWLKDFGVISKSATTTFDIHFQHTVLVT